MVSIWSATACDIVVRDVTKVAGSHASHHAAPNTLGITFELEKKRL